MKSKTAFITLLFITTFSFADYAPSSANAVAVHCSILSGTGYLAEQGESIVFTIPETQDFTLVGDENVADGDGTYLWTKTGANTATMFFNDLISGVAITYSLIFTTQDGGTFSANAPNVGTQTGTFIWRYMLKPSEVSSTLGGGKPVVKVENNTAKISFQIKESRDLLNWNNPVGTTTSDDNGKVTFSTTVSPTNAFYRLDLVTE